MEFMGKIAMNGTGPLKKGSNGTDQLKKGGLWNGPIVQKGGSFQRHIPALVTYGSTPPWASCTSRLDPTVVQYDYKLLQTKTGSTLGPAG